MSVYAARMGSVNEGQGSTDQPASMKYSKAADIDTDDFMAAVHEQTGGKATYMYTWEIAWALSDHDRLESGLSPAPDVKPFAVEQKARQLAKQNMITEAHETGKSNYYLIPAKEQADG
jgi:hypothetical protein